MQQDIVQDIVNILFADKSPLVVKLCVALGLAMATGLTAAVSTVAVLVLKWAAGRAWGWAKGLFPYPPLVQGILRDVAMEDAVVDDYKVSADAVTVGFWAKQPNGSVSLAGSPLSLVGPEKCLAVKVGGDHVADRLTPRQKKAITKLVLARIRQHVAEEGDAREKRAVAALARGDDKVTAAVLRESLASPAPSQETKVPRLTPVNMTSHFSIPAIATVEPCEVKQTPVGWKAGPLPANNSPKSA